MRGESRGFVKGGKPQLPKGTMPGIVRTVLIVGTVYSLGFTAAVWWKHAGSMIFTEWMLRTVPDMWTNVPSHLHGIPSDPHTWGAR